MNKYAELMLEASELLDPSGLVADEHASSLVSRLRAAAEELELQELSDEELVAWAAEEQFFLFCDQDEFLQIARAVLERFRAPQPAEQQSVPEGVCLDPGHRKHKRLTGESCTCPKYVRHPQCDRHEARGYVTGEAPDVSGLVEALEAIAEWVARWTSPGHPIENIARQALDAHRNQESNND